MRHLLQKQMNMRDNLAGECIWIQLQYLEYSWVKSRATESWRGLYQVGGESDQDKNRVKSSNCMTSCTTGIFLGVHRVVSETGSR